MREAQRTSTQEDRLFLLFTIFFLRLQHSSIEEKESNISPSSSPLSVPSPPQDVLTVDRANKMLITVCAR